MLSDLLIIIDWEKWANVSTTLGFSAVIYAAIRIWLDRQKEKKQEVEDRDRKELEIFNNLNRDWRHFMHLNMQYPVIKLFITEPVDPVEKRQWQRRHIMYEMLVSLFESAYRHFQHYPLMEARKGSQEGWHKYLCESLATDEFRNHVKKTIDGAYYSTDFTKYLNETLKQYYPEKEN